jgi:hypothetical protein
MLRNGRRKIALRWTAKNHSDQEERAFGAWAGGIATEYSDSDGKAGESKDRQNDHAREDSELGCDGKTGT